jgi:hypothetical protein
MGPTETTPFFLPREIGMGKERMAQLKFLWHAEDTHHSDGLKGRNS